MTQKSALSNIVIVAFQFPPMSGSSGLLRVLKFCRYLPEFGWTPTVITANPRLYQEVDNRQLALIPANLHVIRARGLDAKRHLSIRGRYPRFLALPDAWASWSFSAVVNALRLIRRHKVKVVLTTFPIASAIWVGLVLHHLKGIPWVVDFRDSMTEDSYPTDPTTRRLWRWLERQAIRRASLILFTARSTIRMYLNRYPELSPEKCVLLPNGYDEADFVPIETARSKTVFTARPFQMLHSGLVYPHERDPWPFFHALARLRKEGGISPETLQVNFRAAGFEETYGPAIRNLDLSEIVHFLPRIPYIQSLQECLNADALLIMQASNCDHQIPAKAYEYLRVGKPILALTTESGDTAALLREAGGSTIVNLHDEEAIYRSLPEFLHSVVRGQHPLPDHQVVIRYARQNLTHQLADNLNRLVRDVTVHIAGPS